VFEVEMETRQSTTKHHSLGPPPFNMSNPIHVKQLSSKLSNMKFMMRAGPPSNSGSPAKTETVEVRVDAKTTNAAPGSQKNELKDSKTEDKEEAKLVIPLDSSYLSFLPSAPVGRMSFGKRTPPSTDSPEKQKDKEAGVTDAEMARTIGVSGFGKRRREDDEGEDRGSKQGLQVKDGGVKKAKNSPWGASKGGGGKKGRFFRE